MEITGLKVSLRKGEDVLVGIKMMKITAGCKRKHLTWRWGQTQEQEQAAQRCGGGGDAPGEGESISKG